MSRTRTPRASRSPRGSRWFPPRPFAIAVATVAAGFASLLGPAAAHADVSLIKVTNEKPRLAATFKGADWFVDGSGRLRGLYRTDGKPTSTKLVARLEGFEPGYLDQAGIVAVQGQLLFTTTSSYGGPRVLMRSDGTATGTQRVLTEQRKGAAPVAKGKKARKAKKAEGELSVSAPIVAGDQVFVNTLKGEDVWTLMRVDLASGTLTPVLGDGVAGSPVATTSEGGLYFIGGPANGQEGGLWLAPPTGPPVRLSATAGRNVYGGSQYGALGDALYFTGSDPEHGAEPWVTDGTPAGTRLIADFTPGTASSDVAGFETTNGSAYALVGPSQGFAEDGPHTAYLLTGMGAPAAVLLGGAPVVTTGRFYVASEQGGVVTGAGAIWLPVSNGASSATVLVRVPAGATVGEVAPGPAIDENGALIVPGTPFYRSRNTLRSTDAAGVTTILGTTGYSYSKAGEEPPIVGLSNSGGRAWFFAPVASGGPIVRWRSDGTPAGTGPVVTPGQIDPVGGAITAQIAGRNDTRAPYRWRVTGTMTPIGILPGTAESLCKGTVALTVSLPNRVRSLHRVRAKLRWNGTTCSFERTVAPPQKVLRAGRGKLVITTRLDRTDHLFPRIRTPRQSVRYR